jgi:hypothetical protein
MTVPASKVRSCCTTSEVALVRASRKGQLEQLSQAELKRLAVRARSLFDKWRGLGRGQSRARSRKVGFGDLDANTGLKAQIFRDALHGFEAQIEKLAGSAAPAAKAAKPKLKRHRTAEHRSARAAVRKGMTAVEDLLNTPGQRRKKPAASAAPAPASSPKPAPVVSEPKIAASPTKPTRKVRSAAKAAQPAKRPSKVPAIDPAKQRQAISAAKKSRVVRSGTTTRTFAHAASRGKRMQARRDSRS